VAVILIAVAALALATAARPEESSGWVCGWRRGQLGPLERVGRVLYCGEPRQGQL